MFNYMPHFEDDLGNTWEVITINFVIMGFGCSKPLTARNN